MPRKDLADNLPEIDWSRFEGIAAPAYTQTPDEVFDWIMAYLTGAELKVLLYIVRRTFGFKKAADAISLDQLCNGIVRRDGRRLDLGTGLRRPTVLAALRALRDKKLIVARQQRDLETGSRPTVYALNIRENGREEANSPVTTRGMAGDTPGYRDVYPGVYQNIPPGIPLKTGEYVEPDAGIDLSTLPLMAGKTPGVDRVTPAASRGADPQETGDQETANQERGDSKSSKSSKGSHQNNVHENGSGGERATAGGRRYSAYISQVISDYSQQFHDSEHERSNRTRAMRLWVESELDEETFVEMLHEARGITQKRAVERDATDGSPEGTKNRMPYFFRVVEDLVSMAVVE